MPTGKVTDLRERDDHGLIEQMAARDEDGLRGLYRRYGGIALGLAQRVTSSRALAEEIVQEVFVKAWERAEDFDPGRGSVRSWLLTQVHHRSVDVVRREEAQRRRDRHLTLDLEEPSQADAIVEEAWISEQRKRVRSALTTLSGEQRQVLELAYFDGRTQRQISELTGVPIGTVKSRTMVGLRRLRSVLEGEEAG